MIRFSNDYSECCHPRILEILAATNTDGYSGYSTDPHTAHAHDLIRKAIDCPDADVHIMVGGTQANLITISAFLRSFEAVIAADSGHICVHETGAIEATGHKCIACPTTDGKLTPALITAALNAHSTEHMVLPKMVYISNTTEVGTYYTTAELEAIRTVCDEHGLLLFLDGARLGSALATGTMVLSDLARLCDLFYIGGTKNGAMMGEALVIVNPALKENFRFAIKQHGGLMAKGWLLGVQFEVLMQDDFYIEQGAHSNRLALQLKEGIAALGYTFASDSMTNQQFPIFPDEIVAALGKEFTFEYQSKPSATHTEIRLVTSWATKESAVTAFLSALKALTK
ncbi:MAG: aminotransferase class I/II-fold pyridoxal phosphate-dependent enzyme [Faecalibacterium sp.]